MKDRKRIQTRASALILALPLAGSIIGCGKANDTVNAAPPSAPYGYVPPPQQQPRAGLSGGQKLAILAGTAALIYMYNKHKHAQGTGAQGRYYLSKNGRVYYRDARGNAVWVTPPAGGIQVPQDRAAVYQRAAEQSNWDVDDTSAAPAGYGASGGYAPSGPPGPRRF